MNEVKVKRYDGQRSIGGNPILRQYELEDTAGFLLHDFGYRPGKTLAVDAEAFARYIGLQTTVGYIDDSPFSLCALAFEPQTLRVPLGTYTLDAGEAVIERAIIDRCDAMLYRYAVMHAAAHLYLHDTATDEAQYSFDLKGTQSVKHVVCDIGDLLDIFEDDRMDGRLEREGQADNLAQCLLMPKNPFKLSTNAYMKEAGINRAQLVDGELTFCCRRLSEMFEVPEFAVLLRLKKLLYI